MTLSYYTTTQCRREPKILVNVLLTESQLKIFDRTWKLKNFKNRSEFLRNIIMENIDDSLNNEVER